LTGYDSLASEVKLGLHSRIDLRLGAACWVEVKSCTLVADGLAQFPDAPSARALRHLNELMAATQSGQRGVMLYLVGRGDAESFAPAAHIDPAYADGLKAASAAGVEVLAYSLEVSTAGLSLGRRLALAL
jgi:sugar fermentation stimulation protein A